MRFCQNVIIPFAFVWFRIETVIFDCFWGWPAPFDPSQTFMMWKHHTCLARFAHTNFPSITWKHVPMQACLASNVCGWQAALDGKQVYSGNALKKPPYIYIYIRVMVWGLHNFIPNHCLVENPWPWWKVFVFWGDPFALQWFRGIKGTHFDALPTRLIFT